MVLAEIVESGLEPRGVELEPGSVLVTVYTNGNVCVDTVEIVDYMGMPYPQPVTICSANSVYDPVGSLYVDLSGEGRVGDSVIVGEIIAKERFAHDRLKQACHFMFD